MEHMHKDTGDVDRHTKEYITNPVIELYGGVIDLDPASSLEANSTIKATKIFTPDDDGLTQEWHGNVWMNHPFSRTNNPLWLNYAYMQWVAGNTKQLVNITFSSTSSNWWQQHYDRATAICYPEKRSVYKKKDTDKSGAMKDSSIFYFGPNAKKFVDIFQHDHKIGVASILR